MKLYQLLVPVLLPIAAACSRTPDFQSDSPPVRDSAGVRIVENSVATWATPWQVVEEPALRIGSVEDDAGQALHQVTGALSLADGRIIVANAGTYELRFYDQAGEFVSSSGGRGGGPGEFSSIELIDRFGADSLLVVDVWGHRVSFFDSDGLFGRSVLLEPNADISIPRALGVFSDGSLLASKGLFVLGAQLPARSERKEQPIFRYQPDGRSAENVGSFPGGESAVFETGRVTPTGRADVIRMARRFGSNTAYAVAGNRFYVGDNATYEIEVYSPAGRLTHLVRRSHTPLVVTDSDLRLLEDSFFANESDRISRRSWGNRPPPPETMPAYAPELHVDSDLNLWVREYTRPGDLQRSYSVFDSSGVFLGEVALPRGLTILDVGRNYVLGIFHDELDVEFVQLHELRKGAGPRSSPSVLPQRYD